MAGGRKHKGGCCGMGGGKRSALRKTRKHRGGSVVADALVTVGALAAWKYFSKKGGGTTRKLPKRTFKNKGAR